MKDPLDGAGDDPVVIEDARAPTPICSGSR
jgi:hypothetical protein